MSTTSDLIYMRILYKSCRITFMKAGINLF